MTGNTDDLEQQEALLRQAILPRVIPGLHNAGAVPSSTSPTVPSGVGRLRTQGGGEIASLYLGSELLGKDDNRVLNGQHETNMAGLVLWGLTVGPNGEQIYSQIGYMDAGGVPRYYSEDGVLYDDGKGQKFAFTKKGEKYVDKEGRELTLSADGNQYSYTDKSGNTHVFTKKGDQFYGADGHALEFVKKGDTFSGPVYVGGKALNGGTKEVGSLDAILASTDPALKSVRDSLLQLQRDAGPYKAGMMVSVINEGMLYALLPDPSNPGQLRVKGYPFVSGGANANDPAAQDIYRSGPTPWSRDGRPYTLKRYTDNFLGRGQGAGWMVNENGGDHNLWNGRSACAFHTLGSSGRTAGCHGYPQRVMAELDHDLSALGTSHTVVVTNTKRAERIAAGIDPQAHVQNASIEPPKSKPSVTAISMG